MALWKFWTTILHRSTDEFWSLSPREIHACIECFYEFQDVENRRFGEVIAACYNSHRTDRKQKVWAWTDFFRPFRKVERKPVKSLDDLRAEFYEMKRIKNGETIQ